MTMLERTEQAVRWLLDGIRDMQHLDILMPHRFEVEALNFEEKLNPFAPSLRHWRVTATVKVPVLWTPINGRAALPPARDNVEEFRRLIQDNAPYAPSRRVTVMRWTVTPDDYVALPARGEPAPDWTVCIVFDVL